MARTRRGRPVNGILLLDKPAGMTSNRALRQVSRWLDARKAGHTGSLDPLATGLLVLCFGEATKFSGGLLAADKQYQATARLGVTTRSADADGEVLERRAVPALDDDRLEQVVARFRGPIEQIPPMVSALKHQGRRLHELARAGIEVPRAPRRVHIHRLRARRAGADRLELQVDCSKGTYIRSLVADIGAALGCGAHVEALRRTALGPFRAPAMITLAALEARAAAAPAQLDDWLLPPDAALADYPAVSLAAAAAARFGQGQAVPATRPAAAAPGTAAAVRVYAASGEFLGVGESGADGVVKPRRLLVQQDGRG